LDIPLLFFSVIVGYFLRDGLSNLLGFVGIAIIILGGLLVAWEKNDNLGVGKKDVNGN
jgi:flagellar motor component MotA